MEKIVDTWINKGKFAKLAQLWVKGQSIDWNKLYYGRKMRRVSLPGYPFAKENYWIPDIWNKSGASEGSGIESSMEGIRKRIAGRKTLAELIKSKEIKRSF
jgi:acyl transferase domain-containing protein